MQFFASPMQNFASPMQNFAHVNEKRLFPHSNTTIYQQIIHTPMKKIFTLLLMAFVTVCAHAVQVWSGNVTLSNYTRSEEVILPAAPFANAEVGDKLIVHFTEYTADPQSWHQVELWTWVADTQSMGEALTQPGYHISPGDTECTFIITENLLAALKDGVAAMAGTGYVLTSVDYESAAGGDGTLWEGESVFANWVPSEQVLIPASFFVTAKEGDNLVYTVKCNDPEAWAAIRAEAGDWSGPIGDSDHVITSTEYTDVKVILDATLLANVQAKGIVMVGDNVTLSKVAVKAAGSQQGDAAYGVLWEGNLTFANWGASDPDFYLEGKLFKGSVAGDKLVVTAHKTNADAWGAFRPESHVNWAAFPGLDNYFENLGAEPAAVEIELTDALAGLLAAEGMHFSGDNCVITKIELVSGFEAPEAGILWAGSVSFDSWTPSGDLSVAAEKFNAAKVGDKLIVTAKKNTDGVWAALRAEGADWCGALAGQEYIELTDGDAQKVTINITEALLADLKAHGLRFSGDNLTITKVVLESAEDEEPAEDALWTGELNFVDWTPAFDLSFAGDKFEGVNVGDFLVVTGQRIEADVWGAFRVEGGDWCGALAGMEYIEFENESSDKTIEITEALLADLKAHGMRFSGTNCVITKVDVRPAGETDGIAAITASKTSVSYDLLGRKTNAAHGISIVGGRKVIK